MAPGGEVPVRTAHTLFHDKKGHKIHEPSERNTMGPRASAGHHIDQPATPEGVGARWPVRPVEMPPRVKVTKMYICSGRREVRPHAGMSRCDKALAGKVPSCIAATQSDACSEPHEE